MNPSEFYARLKAVGIDYKPVTIRKWVSEGVVQGPAGRTRSAQWSEEFLGEVAASYVLRERYRFSLEDVRRVIGLIREVFPAARVFPRGTGIGRRALTAAVCAYWKGRRGIPLSEKARVVYWQESKRPLRGETERSWRLREVVVTASDEDEVRFGRDDLEVGSFPVPVSMAVAFEGATPDDMDELAQRLTLYGLDAHAERVSPSSAAKPKDRSDQHALVATVRTARDLAVVHAAECWSLLRRSDQVKDYRASLDEMMRRRRLIHP